MAATRPATGSKFAFRLPSLPFLPRRDKFVRRHSRHECFIVGVMELTERRVGFDGAVMELSLGGLLFRPASRFLLDRAGEDVSVRFADLKVKGRLMNTRPVGYGIKFDTTMSPDTFEMLVRAYGLVGETASAADLARIN